MLKQYWSHNREVKVVTAALRDAGFEVIYSELRKTVEAITESALQEDVDVLPFNGEIIPKKTFKN